MGSVSDSWVESLTIDTTDHKSSVSATVTLTLTCEHTPKHSLNGAAMLKIGCTYYNSNNDPIGMDGNALPPGETYSKYCSIASMGGGGNPCVLTASITDHDGAAYCRASPPPGVSAAGRDQGALQVLCGVQRQHPLPRRGVDQQDGAVLAGSRTDRAVTVRWGALRGLPRRKPASLEVQQVGKGDGEGSAAPPGLSGWQMAGVIFGALAAGAALYSFLTTPVRDSARFEADTRASIAQLERDRDSDRKAAAELREAVTRGLNAAGSETQALRLQISDMRGDVRLILERTPRR